MSGNGNEGGMSMQSTWELLQAGEAARVSVLQLAESAARSKVHKQRCQEVAQAAEHALLQLDQALRSRSFDHITILSAAARLSAQANRSRGTVDAVGNPGALGRLAATFQRKNAERVLTVERRAFLELFGGAVDPYAAAAASLRFGGGNLPTAGLMALHQMSMAGMGMPPSAKSSVRDGPPPLMLGASSAPGALPSLGTMFGHHPLSPDGGHGDAHGTLAHAQSSNSALFGIRGLDGLSTPKPPASFAGDLGDPTDLPSSSKDIPTIKPLLPFTPGVVRQSDGALIRKLCFMRGAGDTSSIQLMVVSRRLMQVFSSGLEDFHSDTPVDVEEQELTACTLYEPCLDLITGHHGGTVLVYGRPGLQTPAQAAAIAAAAVGTAAAQTAAAAAAAAAAAQAGVPLVIRLSRHPVTALHCVPGIELPPPPTAAAAAAAAAVATGATPIRSSDGGAQSPSAPAQPLVGSIDDVLLFTGDQSGRVMAVRYNRVQPEVLAATVFTAGKRAVTGKVPGKPPPATTSDPANLRITGMLYRGGTLVISTAGEALFSVRVTAAPPGPAVPSGNSAKEAAAAVAAAKEAAAKEGAAASQAPHRTNSGPPPAPSSGLSTAQSVLANVPSLQTTDLIGSGSGGSLGTAPSVALKPSSSVSLLTPQGSTLPKSAAAAAAAAAAAGGSAGSSPSGSSSDVTAATATSGGGAASPTAAAAAAAKAGEAKGEKKPDAKSADSGPTTIRKGTLQLSTAVVDSFSFAGFGGCTALVAVDWYTPGAASAASVTGGGASAEGTTTNGGADVPFANFWSSPAAAAGNASLGCWGADAAAADALATAGSIGAPPPPQRGRMVTARTGSFRMLTAHTNGQLLMWDLPASRLQLLCAIGDQGPKVVSVSIFPDLGMMVEALASGFLRVGPPPSAALAPPINPLGGVPVWRLRNEIVRAHQGKITASTTLGHCVATGSKAGGVKVWSAVDLRNAMASVGISFLPPALCASYSGGLAAQALLAAAKLTNPEGAAAAAAAAAGAPPPPSARAGPPAAPPSPLAAGALGGDPAMAAKYPGSAYVAPAAPPPSAFVGLANIAAAPSSNSNSTAAAAEDRYPMGGGMGAAAVAAAAVAGGGASRPGSMGNLPAMPSVLPPPSSGGLASPSGGGGAGPYPGAPAPYNRLNSDQHSVGSGSNMPHMGQPPPYGNSGPGGYPGHSSAGQMHVPGPQMDQGYHGMGPGMGQGMGPGMGPPGPSYHGMGHVPGTQPPQGVPHYPSGGGGMMPFGGSGSAWDAPPEGLRSPIRRGMGSTAGAGGFDDMEIAAAANGLGGAPGHHMSPGPNGNVVVIQEGVLSNSSSVNGGAAGGAGLAAAAVAAGAAYGATTAAKQAPANRPPRLSTDGTATRAAPPMSPRPGDSAKGEAKPREGGLDRLSRRPSSSQPTNAFAAALEGELANVFGGGGGKAAAAAEEEKRAAEAGNKLPVVPPAGLTAQEAEEEKKAATKMWNKAGTAVIRSLRTGGSSALGGGMDGGSGRDPQMPVDVMATSAVPNPYGAPPPPGGGAYPSMPDGYMFPGGQAAAVAAAAQHQQQQWGQHMSVPQPQAVPYSRMGSMNPMAMSNSDPAYGAPHMLYGNQTYGMQSLQAPPSPYSHGPAPIGYPPPGLPAPSSGDLYGNPMGGHNGGMQHVPGPYTYNRRGSMMHGPALSDYDGHSRRTSMSGHHFEEGMSQDDLPVPPVLPPPAPDPNAAPPPANNQASVNPLLQNCFIRPDDLRLIDPIGQGAEGTVWRGRWHHIDVAVKEMHPKTASFDKLVSIAKDLSSPESARSNEVLAGVIKEVSALMDLGQHPNIIRFVGVCAEPPRIVTEYYKMGSLFSLLKEARAGNMRTREKLSWGKRLVMLQDIAAGMAYLHSRNYIHGDLRSPNVFVTEDQHLKIGDFGFARILGNTQDPDAGVPARLTNPRWQAPEVYAMTNAQATTAADVYSFGIIMYEMLTYANPYDDVADDTTVMMRHMMTPEWRPRLPQDERLPVPPNVHLQAFKALMQDCWAVDPSDRPAFHKIAERLMALIRWQRTLSQVRRSLLGARQFKASTMRRNAEAAAAAAAAAAGGGDGTASPGAASDLAASLEHDDEIDRDLIPVIKKRQAEEAAAAAAAAAVAAAAQAQAAAGGQQSMPPPPPPLASVTSRSHAPGAGADLAAAAAAGAPPPWASQGSQRASKSALPPAQAAAAAAAAVPLVVAKNDIAGAPGTAPPPPPWAPPPPVAVSSSSQQPQPPSPNSPMLESVLTLAAMTPPAPPAVPQPPPLQPQESSVMLPTPPAPQQPPSTGGSPYGARRTAASALGTRADGFGLLTPFHAVDLDDDDSAAAMAAAKPPPAAARPAAPPAFPHAPPPAPTPAVRVAAPAPTPTPAPSIGAAAAAAGGASARQRDVFAMDSPFHALGGLDSDDDDKPLPPPLQPRAPAAAAPPPVVARPAPPPVVARPTPPPVVVQVAAPPAAPAHAPMRRPSGVAVAAPAAPGAVRPPPSPKAHDPFAMSSPFFGSLDDDD
ncbi:hypothetical protein HYH03_006010 [Edaphochlamys debaryana]|uniref:Protein kinase domain-containing protein n=1 Tax=Edaphochlamys debaryana TaxID=47281 RepID=A0A836C0F0_9CHLO|nr:hypothetical protein HYH03_006010 [Edaphochlamys debaryana]|eukprot:KAG2495761.1 hypothetical protein HYH03_006010 [Edaphochlamys debaryana]